MASVMLYEVLATSTGHAGGGEKYLFMGLAFEAASLGCGVFGKQLLRLGYLRKRCWVRGVGFFMQAVGGPSLDAVALALAAQSVLVLFAGLDVVGTLLVAPILLGERLRPRKVAGAAFITLGTLTAVAFGPRGGLPLALPPLLPREAEGLEAPGAGALLQDLQSRATRQTTSSSGSLQGLSSCCPAPCACRASGAAPRASPVVLDSLVTCSPDSASPAPASTSGTSSAPRSGSTLAHLPWSPSCSPWSAA